MEEKRRRETGQRQVGHVRRRGHRGPPRDHQTDNLQLALAERAVLPAEQAGHQDRNDLHPAPVGGKSPHPSIAALDKPARKNLAPGA
jgi:hypothetical protein